MSRAFGRCRTWVMLGAWMLLAGGVVAGPLQGKHVAFLVGEGFHDGETFIPMAHLINRGAKVTVIGVEPAVHTAYNSAITAHIHRSVDEVSVEDFDALVIPGGRSPNWLRAHTAVVDFTRDFFESGRVVAAICHGPQVLVTAGVLDDIKATSFPRMSDELKAAGVVYIDGPVVIDKNLITSRIPDDIPEFVKAIEEALLD